MDFRMVLRVALRALARNKMRSSLTMLGIVIGVCAVIAMVGVGQGAEQQGPIRIAQVVEHHQRRTLAWKVFQPFYRFPC